MIHVVRLDKRITNPSSATGSSGERLSRVLKATLPGREFRRIKSVSEFLLAAMTGEVESVLFAVSIPSNGYAPEWQDLIASLMDRPNLLMGTKAVVVVDGEGPLFTKDIARKLIFAANYAGAEFPGRPLVEATGDLYNFNTIASIKGIENQEAYVESVVELLDKLESFSLDSVNPIAKKAANPTDTKVIESSKDLSSEEDYPRANQSKKKILAIHASNKDTSNTLMLLDMVKSNLVNIENNTNCNTKAVQKTTNGQPGIEIDYREISIRNGDIVDCRGCGFATCKHFGEKGECFYGGLMVEQVYPAILDCDTLILVCPNYNDSVGANMMAMFNRLTALFYNNSFEEKKIYALIVSGYSGGDLLAEQIIGAMNCNKGFILPPHFAMIETANDPGSIAAIEGIRERAETFAKSLISEL